MTLKIEMTFFGSVLNYLKTLLKGCMIKNNRNRFLNDKLYFLIGYLMVKVFHVKIQKTRFKIPFIYVPIIIFHHYSIYDYLDKLNSIDRGVYNVRKKATRTKGNPSVIK